MADENRKGVPAVSNGGLPAGAQDAYLQYANRGFENPEQDELIIPRWVILDSKSKKVSERLGAGGDIMNTVTGEIIEPTDPPLIFVPCAREHVFLRFRPIDDGGGFKGSIQPNDPLIRELQSKQGKFGKLRQMWYDQSEGKEIQTEIVESRSFIGMRITDSDSFERSAIAFSSTQLVKYKTWFTTAMGLMIPGTPYSYPLFAHRYALKTKQEQKAAYSWFGWVINFDGNSAAEARIPHDSDLFQAASEFSEALKSGQVKVDYSQAAEEVPDRDGPLGSGPPSENLMEAQDEEMPGF